MAKKKIQKTNAIRLVEQKKIAYKEHEYAWSEDDLGAGHVSEQVAIAPARIFKTLVAVGNKTGPVVAVIPSDHELDLKKIATARVHSRRLFTDRDEEAVSNFCGRLSGKF